MTKKYIEAKKYEFIGGGSSDLSGGSTQSSSLSAASLEAGFLNQNFYGLPIQPNSNSQIAIQFDATTGWLAIAGNSNNNIVKQTLTGNGYYQFDIDGHLFSSDRSSASFWQSLDGATRDSLTGINFDGGLGYDTLIVGSLEHINNFGVIADDTIQIQGEVHSESVFFKAKDIINQGSIIAGNITAEFSDSYIDVTDAKIIASNGGNILLNGGKTGDLQATGQFLATGLTGGKIDFRGKTVSLRGANLDASGQNGGGTILIGGDYQGGDSIGLGTLANAQFTFVDEFSNINANALTNGNGGKVIIWSDEDTDFQGNITARGGLKSGDGGFVEVSGKQNLNFVGNVDVKAINGKQGNVLLDPADIIINADDGNKKTFDISDLQKMGGFALSATNNIIFNTEASFSTSGTITLQAGNSVILTQNFDTGGGNLNISGAFINAMDRISSNSSSLGKSGNIRLTSRGGIDLGEVSAYSDEGNAGNITLEASTFIKAGVLNAYASGGGNGGNVRLSANEGISTSDIFTSSNGGGSGGSVNILRSSSDPSKLGSIIARMINTSGGASGGNVRLSANDSISTSDIFTFSNGGGNGGNVNIVGSGGSTFGSIFAGGNIGNGGAVTINAENISMNGINTFANSGNGGKVSLKANQDINLGAIVSSSMMNKAGTIQVVSSEGSINVVKKYNYFTGLVSANSKQGNGANINLTAKQLITTGLIDSGADGDGNGGNVKLEAKGDILTSAIATNSNGNGKSGNVSIVSSGGSIRTTNDSPDTSARYIYAGANQGNSGSVTLTAFGDITTEGVTSSSNTGVAANIKLLAGGNILTGAIASNTFAGSGKGGNITLDGKNITAESLRADSVGADGGQIRLTADKFIQITGSTSVNGKDYSIFTDSKDVAPSSNDTGARSAPILIRHSQKVRDESLTPFIVGDSSKNGTARSISDGIVDFWVSSGNTRKVYDFDFQFNDIYIKRPFALLADISNILGIPGVSILKKDSDIINNILKFSPYIPALDIQSISNSVVSLLSRISKQELVNLGLGIQKADLDKYYSYLITAMAISGINSVDNQAHFLTQVIHESDRFAQTSEGGGASASYAPYYGRGLIQITYPETYRGFGESLFLGDTFVKDPDLVSSKPIFAVLASTWYWTSDFENNKIRGKNWRNSQTNSLLSSFKEIAEDISFSNNVVTDTDGNESDRVERITSILNGGYNALSDRKLVFSKVIQALGN